jgi:hypothetical protein
VRLNASSNISLETKTAATAIDAYTVRERISNFTTSAVFPQAYHSLALSRPLPKLIALSLYNSLAPFVLQTLAIIINMFLSPAVRAILYPQDNLRKPTRRKSNVLTSASPATRRPTTPADTVNKIYGGLEIILRHSATRRLEVPGKLKGKHVTAIPDFGSSFNIIAEHVAVQNQWEIDTSEVAYYSLPNGVNKNFIGTVSLPWSFGSETRKHSCIFHVLRGCVHPILLGRQFLDLTGTFKRNVHRVKETVVNAVSHARKRLLLVKDLNEQTGTSSHIQGLVNGQPTIGLADTGSDLTVIKRSAAIRMGLHIFEGESYTTEVEFVDGSTAFTTGMVRDAEWCFGAYASKAQSIDIHVMDDIPCDFILDKWLLWDAQAFREHQNLFVYPGLSDSHGRNEVCMITEKSRFLQTVGDKFRSIIGRPRAQSQGDRHFLFSSMYGALTQLRKFGCLGSSNSTGYSSRRSRQQRCSQGSNFITERFRPRKSEA